MPQAGFNGRLLINGNALTEARDVTIDMSNEEYDSTSRGDNGSKTFIAGLFEATVTFDMVWKSTMGTAARAVRTAFFGKGTVAVQMLDEDGEGYSATAIVTAYTKNEPIADAQSVSVTLRISGSVTVIDGTS